jgi:hypothetical protein
MAKELKKTKYDDEGRTVRREEGMYDIVKGSTKER